MIPINYNVRSLFVRKATTIAAALGIALVVFVLASSQMLARGIKKTMGISGSESSAIVLRKGADAELSSNLEARFSNIVLAAPGVKTGPSGKPLGAGETLVVIALEKPGGEGQVSNVSVRGVQPGVFELRDSARLVAGRPAKPGTDEVMIGRRLEEQFEGVRLGGSFELKKNRPVKVVGVFEASGSSFESEVWADIETVRTSFAREKLFSSITVQLQASSRFDAFKSALESDKQLDVQVLRERQYFEKQSEGTASLVSFLGGAIVFFFSLGAIIGAMITMYGAVSNRQREIGTMRALGFSRLTILSSFLLEAVILALGGGAVGALASLAMGAVELSMMNMNTWSEVVFSFDPAPDVLLSSTLVGGVMGVFGGLLPALRAARTSPVDAMRA